MNGIKGIGWALACLCGALVGCQQDEIAPPQQEMGGAGVGAACVLDNNCREGLSCQDRACQPAGTKAAGTRCALSGECAEGLYCDLTALCAPAGGAPEGGPCASGGDCQAGLVCVPEGFSGRCVPGGQGDLGAACEGTLDCLAGLGCGVPVGDAAAPMQCLTGPNGGALLPFVGATCEFGSAQGDGPPRPYFALPRGESGEFYRLPFPNDARRKDGRPDLSGHPTPGTAGLGFDLVQTYLDVIQRQQEGFGLNQAIYFRFSDRLDFDRLDANGDNPSHYLVNIDPDSPEYGQRQSLFWQANTAPGRYICGNWMALRPAWGRPLLPGTTYAAVLTDQIRTVDGLPLRRDDDFEAVMSATQPQDPVQAAAWTAYQPLRDFVAAQSLAPETVVGATVFTTGDVYRDARNLREAVARLDPPTASDLVRCDQGVTSPCEDGLDGDAHTRGCFPAQEGFDELHARLSLPIFQVGVAPYLESGGGFSNGGDGLPVLQGRAQVCAALTVPSALPMPEAGWPVLIYAHGTGGTFRNHAQSLAPLLSQISADGAQTGFLILGWDQVQHGDRRGDSDQDPESLVFNFLNPEAARGNFLQAAADIHAIVRTLDALDIDAASSPTGAPIKADLSKIYFLGHSQGGTSGPLALPWAPEIKGAVLSGAGASLTWSLLTKTSPVNLPVGVQVALRDPDLYENHPVLNLLQGYFDAVDPLSYAPYLSARVLTAETSPRHVFHLIGLGDTYTPPRTLQIMSTALRAPLLGPQLEPFQGREVTPVDAPLSANVTTEGQRYTLLSRQYAPAQGEDGHFVLFRDAGAMDDLVEFLGSAVLTDAPTITD
jgi:hypothetical protein